MDAFLQLLSPGENRTSRGDPASTHKATKVAYNGAAVITKTNTMLLEQLTHPGHQDAWEEFDSRYRPILLAFGKRLGLQNDDAEEAALGKV